MQGDVRCGSDLDSKGSFFFLSSYIILLYEYDMEIYFLTAEENFLSWL